MNNTLKYHLYILLFFVSCSTIHKITSKQKINQSSIVEKSIDSSSFKKDTSSNSFQSIKDFDLVVKWDTNSNYYNQVEQKSNINGYLDTIPWIPIFYRRKDTIAKATSIDNGISELIKGAISASTMAGRIPSSISIRIGEAIDCTTNKGIQERTQTTEHFDSSSHIKQTINNIDKTRTGLDGWVYIGIGILLLIVFAVIAWKIFRTFN